MPSDGHDEVAHDEGGTHERAVARYFSEPDGTLWEVVWQAPVSGSTRAIHGTYRFRAIATGESYTIAAGSAGGDRLQRMMPADVQQLLALARSGLVDD